MSFFSNKFTPLKNPSSWRRISLVNWKPPSDPSVYGHTFLDGSAALEYLEKINKKSDEKITITHLVMKALALTIKKYPDINGIIKWGKIYLRNTVDIAAQVAIAEKSENHQPDLSGAKVEQCDKKSLQEIAKDLREHSRLIRIGNDPQLENTKKLLNYFPTFFMRWIAFSLEFLIYNLNLDLRRFGLPLDPFGSAMVTSVGMLGVPAGFPPLVPLGRCPLLLCVGKIFDRPFVINGEVVARPALDFAFTFDHRFIDGMTASRMYNYMFNIMGNPEKYIPIEEK